MMSGEPRGGERGGLREDADVLWRRRRQALAMAHFIASLALIPVFAVMVWGTGDGPAVLSAWGISSPLPGIDQRDAWFVGVMVGFFVATFHTMRLLDDRRVRAINGDGAAIPPAKPPERVDVASLSLPITLVWRRTRRSRLGLMIWFVISLAPLAGLSAVLAWAGLFDFIISQGGIDFWGLCGLVALYAVLLALIPLAILRAALRPPQGVVADEQGVADWSGRDSIAWDDARLLEIGSRRGATVYTLYAADGRSLMWTSRSEDPLYITTHALAESDVNDSPRKAAAILALAHVRAGLTPRTFDIRAADRASNFAAPGNLPLGTTTLPGTWPGSVTMLVGITCGCGVATLAMRSSVFPVMSVVASSTLAVSALWSLLLAVRDALTMPCLLGADRLPAWHAPPGILPDGVAQLQQAGVLATRWGVATRAFLMLGGAIAAIVASVAALADGRIGIDLISFWMNLIWLVFAALVSALRAFGQFDLDRVTLLADASGLRNLRSRRPQIIPWADIASLRFTWSCAAGFRYTATTHGKEEVSWTSQSRQWRDEEPDLAATGIHAPVVDGDAFAGIVAARTGLTPTQELV